MKITNKYQRMALTDLYVERDQRQRREINVDDLVDSIGRYGVLSPIIVQLQEDGRAKILAGERRYTASLTLGLKDIPVRLFADLTPVEQKLIEFEENARRKDLHWRDHVRAIAEIHAIHKAQDPEWTRADTAKSIQLDAGYLTRVLRVAKDLDSPKIKDATTMIGAYNILDRLDGRKYAQAMESIIEGVEVLANPTEAAEALVPFLPPDLDLTDDVEVQAEPGDRIRTMVKALPTVLVPRSSTPAAESLIHGDFLDWAPKYSGERFNFIHCDFPYGINFNAGEWGRQSGATRTYDDSPETYWALCQCLVDNLDRLLTPSAHMMFWFSMDYYQATLDFFRQYSDFAVQKFPLYWAKTDNVGILPDPARMPRRVVETALIASRGDRKIVKPVSNFYGGPTDKRIHQSAKPRPMLHHFFNLFVDETTRMLDPTAGSGYSLQAAEDHNAAFVFGLEYDAAHVSAAQADLRKFRDLKRITK